MNDGQPRLLDSCLEPIHKYSIMKGDRPSSFARSCRQTMTLLYGEGGDYQL